MSWSVVGDVLLVLGGVVFAVGAFGLVRMPDFYSRLGAMTMSGGLAIVLILLGALVHQPSWGNAVLVALAVLIQLATLGVGGGAMARAGFLTNAQRSPQIYWDEITTTDPSHSDPSPPPPASAPGRTGPDPDVR